MVLRTKKFLNYNHITMIDNIVIYLDTRTHIVMQNCDNMKPYILQLYTNVAHISLKPYT